MKNESNKHLEKLVEIWNNKTSTSKYRLMELLAVVLFYTCPTIIGISLGASLGPFLLTIVSITLFSSMVGGNVVSTSSHQNGALAIGLIYLFLGLFYLNAFLIVVPVYWFVAFTAFRNGNQNLTSEQNLRMKSINFKR
jgi:hypothetical protein